MSRVDNCEPPLSIDQVFAAAKKNKRDQLYVDSVAKHRKSKKNTMEEVKSRWCIYELILVTLFREEKNVKQTRI
jgi:hypothetical protein